MKNLFLSWSGAKSQAVAEALYDWIPTVIQSVDPWLSIADIDKGTRWSTEIASQLQQLQVGIICLTSDNLNSPWLLFEAGALSKTIDKTFVCPYLLDIDPTDVQGPFAQFQATRAEKEDTKKLLVTVNKALGEAGIQAKILEKQFEKWWPDLEMRLVVTPKAIDKKPAIRQDRDLLEEILQLVRDQVRNSSSGYTTSGLQIVREWFEGRIEPLKKRNVEVNNAIQALQSSQDQDESTSKELNRLMDEKKDIYREVSQLEAQYLELNRLMRR